MKTRQEMGLVVADYKDQGEVLVVDDSAHMMTRLEMVADNCWYEVLGAAVVQCRMGHPITQRLALT